MSTFAILIEQIWLFVIYIVIGAILVKAKVFDKASIEIIAKFVLKLGLPMLIFSNTVSEVDRATLAKNLYILAIAAGLYLFLYLIAAALAKLFRLTGDRAQIYRAITMFGNIGFMGIPIVTSMYPERGMLYISVFTIVDQLALWTVGVKLTSPTGKGHFNAKKLVNPCTVAITAALFMILTGLRLPGVISTAFSKIGAAATPLAMIYLGGVFACTDAREYFAKKELYGIALIKMFLCPLLVYALLGLLPLPQEVRMTMTMITAMPTMSSVVMMAKASGSDGDYAMGGIFVTTLCSIVILPLVCRLVLLF